MALPGTTVTVRDNPPPSSAPTDSSVWFVAGITQRGPSGPELIESLADYLRVFGDRVSYGLVYDALDVFFREGGSKAYVSRVLGPAPVLATINLETAGATVSLIVNAKSFGDWANGLQVVVAGTGPYTLTIKDADGNTLETSPALADQQAAVDWSAGSDYVDIALGAGNGIPAAGTSTLAGGTDDHANATDTQRKAALDLFTADLGPGQVSTPGATTDQAHLDLLAHASANRRVALLDAADTATVATLTAAADALRGDGRHGGLFAPWATVPGVTASTSRTVPYSAIEAGIIARNDASGLSPNVAAAGENGRSRYAIGLSQPAWDDADRETLNDAGVNVARDMLGGVRTYGYRTLADTDIDPNFTFLTASRLVMEIEAEGLAIGERYVFGQIDGKGHLLADYAGELRAMLTGFYESGSLYGATADDAFTVDVGAQVNPPSQLAEGIIAASVEVRISPVGERVQLFITNRAITEVI